MRGHWVQRITFAAKTNAMCVQSRLGGHTHTHTDGGRHIAFSARKVAKVMKLL